MQGFTLHPIGAAGPKPLMSKEKKGDPGFSPDGVSGAIAPEHRLC